MKTKATFLTIIFSYLSLFGSVEKSIIPCMDQLAIKDLNEKINLSQIAQIEGILPILDQRLRVMSFNMLLNSSESHLEIVDRWENRKDRVVEYVKWANPDVIGSQEFHADQLDYFFNAISDEYDYYGVGVIDGIKGGDIPAIFYRKDRLQLINAQTIYFSETPQIVSNNPFGGKNTFTFCHFMDLKNGNEFVVMNTHLAFGNIHRRSYEACKLRDFLLEKQLQLPVFITGDFNTFPFRQELDIPFFDGDQIVQTIENAGVIDSAKRSIFGHFGPIASTNFCNEKRKPFASQGEPGIILDHIFVSNGISVIIHGIDSAMVNGHFPSDHFPVIIDAIIH